MTSTEFGVVVRQQAWFRPLVDVQDISSLPSHVTPCLAVAFGIQCVGSLLCAK